ncbi:helix-turn-helix domain-containing protein [Oceanidesulfovibrio marinus]|uniref:XRE family transcriptional regulator n=1 Tax=Oceanidesulfovibrio marinus TaxID=370038 RepID=A0A6P1ZIU3_9BACT|nr:helix-turn-helix transcriptional regulator [Oceanidesulfovibrio marinus]TVM34901.1 XRE family transcriptional regulator [Oceanidesulfovibrio marinus]
MTTQFVKGSGNVFADLGLPDAEELKVKAQLVLNLEKIVKKHQLTPREVAKRCETDQSTISKVLRGKLDLVTVERLIRWHSLLNQEITIVIRDSFSRDTKTACGHVQVIVD